MSIALLASCRSPCQRLNVGSVIVKNIRLMLMGYNGYIPSASHICWVQNNHEQSIIYSEVNALSDCAKRSISLEGAKIYVTQYSCLNCFKSITACGIKEVVYLEDYNNNQIVKELENNLSIIIKKEKNKKKKRRQIS
jgi:dCMP deaminase